MLFNHSYKTIKEETTFLYKDKGSKFFGFAFPLITEDDFKTRLQNIKKKYPDATHHCYALILNPDKSFQKSNDDGEPANTAGKPILRAILSSDLTNVGVVVVRYFGGTMLGVPGLIHAYNTTAAETLKLAEIVEVQIEDSYELQCEFPKEGEAHRFLKMLEAKIISVNHKDDLCIHFALPRAQTQKLRELKEKFYSLKIIELCS